MTGIYKITNTVNEKCYIGQSIDIKKRWAKHKREAFAASCKHYHYPLYQDIREYGIENFEFEVLEECDAVKLNNRESYYIKQYDSLNNGYNQTEGGGGQLHYNELTEDVVLTIIQELKTSCLKNPEIGKKLGVSENLVQDINLGNLYRKNNEQYPLRKPQDCAKTEIDETLYFCKRCGEPIVNPRANLCRKCVHETQQTVNRPEPLVLAKMIKEVGFERTGKYFGVSGNSIIKWCKAYGIPYHKNKLVLWYDEQMDFIKPIQSHHKTIGGSKPVYQIEPISNKIIATFESTNVAARVFGRQKGTSISEVCNGHRDLAYGFKWCYVEDYEKFLISEELIVKKDKIETKRPVYQLDPITNKIITFFESIKAASEPLGGDHSARVNISKACRGQRKTAYGSKWCYVEDYIPPTPTSTSSTQTSNPIK